MKYSDKLTPQARSIISTFSPEGVGAEMAAAGVAATSQAWTTASQAIFVPIVIERTVTVVAMFIEGGTSSAGNLDIGIFDRGGSQIVNIGSTAMGGLSSTSPIVFDIADKTLNPGLYYFGLALTDTNAQVQAYATVVGINRAVGVVAVANAVPLPGAATFVAASAARIPLIGAIIRTTI